MGANSYHFIDRWRVRGTAQEVSDILRDGPALARWWPSTYREVVELEAGDADGVGSVHRLRAKGWLPYTIRFSFRVIDAHHPHGFVIDAWGDLTGRGEWTIVEDGDFVAVTYDWRIRADKALLRWLSPVVKPVLQSNHRWTMRKGGESLKLELLRRRDTSAEVGSPPGPAGVGWWVVVGVVVTAVVVVAWVRSRGRRLLKSPARLDVAAGSVSAGSNRSPVRRRRVTPAHRSLRRLRVPTEQRQ